MDGRKSMLSVSASIFRTVLAIGASVFVSSIACSGDRGGQRSTDASSSEAVIRITGSDTMVNLVQAWAENYKQARPDVSVQVAGGGSGVGFAGLSEGILDIAAASREMENDEKNRAKVHNGTQPQEFTVALDALAVYVHKGNPLDSISIEELAEIYGEWGQIQKWSQLGITNPACRSDAIIRVGRQNSSGTYAYFREIVLGHKREYKLGSIDQSGSKDVAALVSRTPCAIGYSGMAFAVVGVKALKVSKKKGGPMVAPTADAAISGSYPIARRLYLYTPGEPVGETKAFLDWVLGIDGQQIVRKVGFVPVRAANT
jgi:phosphate transport system substrate-binding protein